ncbi:hypothetical protein P5673_027148 [Acropora cervicornis]|uniref:Uncharacterized protein n=1 Tax=Acropora cervicornis TaxID=6130 RepID=A0AAD9PZW9_ACRCE|nr:hypothetical protein P5673_027148 [Acropora cervicornis]
MCDSQFHMDAFWDEKLNDIDEFIQSELGSVEPEGPTILNLQTLNLKDDQAYNPERKDTFFCSPHNLTNKLSEVEMEVQIMDLKDVYDKKTRRTSEGLEYRLEDSEVTAVLQASQEINCVRAYVQRCPEAAIRTHDTIGPVELDINTLQSGAKRRVVSIDLGSVYKTKDGDPVYWLEKADVMQRNKWEIIIVLEFSPGLSGNVTSKPFRVTTKAGYKTKHNSEHDVGSPSNVQRIARKITASHGHPVSPYDSWERFRTLSSSGHDEEDVPDGACALSEEIRGFSLFLTDNPQSPSRAKSDPFTKGKVLFQPNTVLDKRMVKKYYDRQERIHQVVEQADLPGLLKLVGHNANLAGSPRRKANGHKSTDKNMWWACGRCFFERPKKSTIKAHVTQLVCQKTAEIKKSRSKVSKLRRQRHFSCEFDHENFDSYSWRESLSV